MEHYCITKNKMIFLLENKQKTWTICLPQGKEPTPPVTLRVNKSLQGAALTVELLQAALLTLHRLLQDALLDMVRRSRIHFVHCILPKVDALKALSGSLFKAGESETQRETGDPGLMQLDVALLRAQIRGSKLLDALRIYRQGEVAPLSYIFREGIDMYTRPGCPCLLG